MNWLIFVDFRVKGHATTMQKIFGQRSGRPTWRQVVELLGYLRILPNTRNGNHTEINLGGTTEKIQHSPCEGDTVNPGTVAILREFLSRSSITPDNMAAALKDSRRRPPIHVPGRPPRRWPFRK